MMGKNPEFLPYTKCNTLLFYCRNQNGICSTDRPQFFRSQKMRDGADRMGGKTFSHWFVSKTIPRGRRRNKILPFKTRNVLQGI